MAAQVTEQVMEEEPAPQPAQQDKERHGTAAGYARHRRAGEPACEPCADAARELWRAKARRRFARVPEQIRDTNRRSRAKAVRCRVCGKVVKEEEAVLVEPLRSARGPLTCHRPCAESRGRLVVTNADPGSTLDRSGEQVPAPSARP